jgi:hypothetical protein
MINTKSGAVIGPDTRMSHQPQHSRPSLCRQTSIVQPAEGFLELSEPLVASLRFTAHIEVAPGMTARRTVVMKRPVMVRMEFIVQGMTGMQAYDGKAGWNVISYQGKKDAEPMVADDVKNMEGQADFDGALRDYKAKRSTVEYLGKDKAEGSEAYELKVTKRNGIVATSFIDADSGLEVKAIAKTTLPLTCGTEAALPITVSTNTINLTQINAAAQDDSGVIAAGRTIWAAVTKIAVIVQTAWTCGTNPTNAYINFAWNVLDAS